MYPPELLLLPDVDQEHRSFCSSRFTSAKLHRLDRLLDVGDESLYVFGMEETPRSGPGIWVGRETYWNNVASDKDGIPEA
jgi:hypothetical protein